MDGLQAIITRDRVGAIAPCWDGGVCHSTMSRYGLRP